jgi:hypothetical protein
MDCVESPEFESKKSMNAEQGAGHIGHIYSADAEQLEEITINFSFSRPFTSGASQ